MWKNISCAFPEKSLDERKRIMQEFYRNLTDSFAETIKLMTMKEEEVKKRFKIINGDLFLHELNQNKLSLALASHFFNWEGITLGVKSLNINFETVYLKVNNSFFDKLMKKIRGRFGGTLVERSQFQRNFIKNRNTPRVIGLAADQRPNRENQRSQFEFMNRKTGFFEGAEILAKKFDLTIIYISSKKVKRGYYESNCIKIAQPPHDSRPHSITEQYIKLTEKNIREEPALYLWSHNRWKNSK